MLEQVVLFSSSASVSFSLQSHKTVIVLVVILERLWLITSFRWIEVGSKTPNVFFFVGCAQSNYTTAFIQHATEMLEQWNEPGKQNSILTTPAVDIRSPTDITVCSSSVFES